MNKNEGNFHLLKKLGEVETVSEGNDSEVFRIKNHEKDIDQVAKEYKHTSVEPENVEKVLREYYSDTEEVRRTTEENPNPLNQKISISGEDFVLEYRILSQGALMLENTTEGYDFHGITDDNSETKILLGQNFIEGANMFDISQGTGNNTKTEAQEIFVSDMDVFNEVFEKVYEFFQYLSEKFKLHIQFATANVKPFLNKENKKITLVITDLAPDLANYHRHSAKFQKPDPKEAK